MRGKLQGIAAAIILALCLFCDGMAECFGTVLFACIGFAACAVALTLVLISDAY